MERKDVDSMKIGITGSHGFIGSHLYSHIKNAYECKAFDKGKYDLSKIETMKTFVNEKELIFHFAGANRATN